MEPSIHLCPEYQNIIEELDVRKYIVPNYDNYHYYINQIYFIYVYNKITERENKKIQEEKEEKERLCEENKRLCEENKRLCEERMNLINSIDDTPKKRRAKLFASNELKSTDKYKINRQKNTFFAKKSRLKTKLIKLLHEAAEAIK